MSIDHVERAERFDWFRKNKPGRGDVLRPISGGSVPVFVDVKDSERRVLFCKCHIDEECKGWFLCDDPKALTVLIIEDEHGGLIEANGGSDAGIRVSALRIIRQNRKGTALIAEPYHLGTE
jgi:hypothetical protein